MKPDARSLLPRLLTIIAALIFFAALFSLGISREKPLGAISGKVCHADDGRPIEGAKVYHPTRDVYVKTDKEGTYTLIGVPETKEGCMIRAYAKGFNYSTYSGIKVSEGKTTDRIDFRMVRRKSHYNLYAYQKVFSPGENPSINLSGYLVKEIDLKVYKLDPFSNLDYLTDSRKLSQINLEEQEPVFKTVYVSKFNDDGDFYDTYLLPLEENGVYVVKTKAVGGSLADTTWVMKTDLGLIVKRSPREIMVYSQSFSTGKPVPGVTMKIYQDKTLIAEGKTDKDGILHTPNYQNKPIKIAAHREKDYAFANTYYGRDAEYGKSYLYTDRPVYRPGQTVFFKGITRSRIGFKYAAHNDVPVDVTVSDSRGTRIYSRRLYTNRWGSFNDSFKLEEEPPLGSYSLQAKYGDNQAYYSFEVSEYKKPEFKIEVSTDKPHYVAGDSIKVKLKGKYYFGAPLAKANFTLTVMESLYRWGGMGWDDYYQGDYDANGGIMFETTGTLDGNGEAVITIPTGKIEYNKELTIQVDVSDMSGRTVTGECSAPLSVGEFALYAMTGKYVYEPGEKIDLKIQAMDFKEKPVANQKVSIKVKHITYEEVKETRGSRGQSINEYTVKRVETQVGMPAERVTDKEGKTSLEFVPRKEGSYEFVIQARDKRGNNISYDNYTYVASESYDGMMGEADLKIITDKKKYHRGDVVKAVITTSTKNMYVLLTIEGRRIYEKKVIKINGGSKTLDIPLKKEYFPNVFISVAAIKNMDLITASENIMMYREEKKLNVAVHPDKERYYPGDKAHYTLEITDHKGKPVQAELSLGVVDEAIYAIAPDNTPNIYEYFWQYEYNYVDTTFSFTRDYSGGADKDRPDQIRKDFKDTAFWDPVVRTDENGKAAVEFQMPDNLTTWVGTVRAATLDTEVGSTVNFVVCTKDLLVRLETPRFLTQRDKLYIGGVVHNYTKESQDIKVWLEAEGVQMEDTEKKTARLKPEEARDFYWPVEAVRPGEARFTLLCKGSTADDAMELPVQVLPFGVKEVKAQSGVMENQDKTATVKLNLPENVIPEVTEMDILLSPSIARTMMDNLDYLIHYPYGCVEQTMSSFLPAIIAQRVFRTLGIRDEAIEKKIPNVVKRGLNKLYEMQHYDGGWGWWENDDTHPYMTAYVVLGLKEAQKNGYDVSTYRLKRGIEALQKMTKDKPEPVKTLGGTVQQGEEWNSRSYVLYALYRVGILNREKILEVFFNRKDMNDYGLALLAMTLDGAGENAKAQKVMNELDNKAAVDDKDCCWDGRTFTYSWVDNKIETTAYCMQAYVQIRPGDPKIRKIIHWLSMNRQGEGYTSTKDTAAVVYAFTNYLLKSQELNPDYIMQVKLNGDPVADAEVKSPTLPADIGKVNLRQNYLKTGENIIDIIKNGEGVLYYTTRLSYFEDKPIIGDAAEGIKVSRKYMKLSRSKDKKGEIHEVTELLEGKPVKRGDRLRVEVTVEADNDYQYVLIEDPLPAGFEVTMSEAEKNWGSLWYCQQEVRDEKVSFFTRRLEKGKQMKLTYDIRSEMYGDVNVLPSSAYAMYEPEVRGRSAGDKLSVTKE